MRALYLGLEPSPEWHVGRTLVHCPLIQIVPTSPQDVEKDLQTLSSCSHLLFTSQTAVKLFCKYLSLFGIPQEKKIVLAVGKKTAQSLTKAGFEVAATAQNETSEGIVEELGDILKKSTGIFWPHSAKSRTVIPDFFHQNHLKFVDCILYDTHTLKPDPMPLLDDFQEIIFTSPSTIDAFLEVFGSLPSGKTLTCIGPVTQARLENAK